MQRKKPSDRGRSPPPSRTPRTTRKRREEKREEEVTIITARPSTPQTRRRSRYLHRLNPSHLVGALRHPALVTQRLEEVKKLTDAVGLLSRGDPAPEALQLSIEKKEVENIKKERAKSMPQSSTRKYSSRQERDKAVSGGRIAYIKEKQRQRAAKHRAESQKDRATQNVRPSKRILKQSSTVQAEARRSRDSFGY